MNAFLRLRFRTGTPDFHRIYQPKQGAGWVQIQGVRIETRLGESCYGVSLQGAWIRETIN